MRNGKGIQIYEDKSKYDGFIRIFFFKILKTYIFFRIVKRQ